MIIPNLLFFLFRKNKIRIYTLSVLLTLAFSLPSYAQPAFPGADGFGKNASGGRGGVVLKVTNLNDSGAGSFRAAVEASGPRTIVFEVGGTIVLNNDLNINNGDLTIAGQTAPGDGICIYGRTVNIAGADNIIVRYLRFRLGSNDNDTVRIYGGSQDIIFDHCSISWGKDENIGITDASDLTFQRCIISEGFNDKNVLLFNSVSNTSFSKNLLANTTERNVESTTCVNMSFEMIDNVIYGSQHRTRIVPENIADYVGNQFISNPSLSTNGQTLKVESGQNCSSPTLSETRVGDINNYEDGTIWSVESELQPYTFNTRQLSGGAVALSDHTQVKDNVLADVGANLVQDELDLHIINDVINLTGGLVSVETQTTGLPNLQGGTPPADSDDDGMPDNWENDQGLNPNNPEDRNDVRSDGYTNLEHYINNIASPSGEPVNVTGVTVTPESATINIPDTISLSRTILPANATNQSGVWSSNNTSIALVDDNGLVTPVNTGVATITYTTSDGGFTDSSTITVTNDVINVTSVSVSPETVNINLFGSATLTASILPTNATDQTGIWESSDTAIATIDQNGIVTPVALGIATMTFTTTDGGFTDSAEVNVNDSQYGSFNFYNADTDVIIQDGVTGGEVFDLDEVGDNINFRIIPQGGDGNTDVESIGTQWTGIDNGAWLENVPLYAGMNSHTGTDFAPYQVEEGTYIFTITYYSGDGATGSVIAIDNFQVTFQRGLTVDAGEDQTICEGDSITLTVTGDANSYVWSTGETTESITVSPSVTTTYTVTGSDLNGNSISDDVVVFVNEIPTIGAGEDQTICQGEAITLTATASSGTYLWNTGETTQSITVSPNSTTTYSVTANNNGCIDSDDVQVFVNPLPTANAGSDVTIVEGDSVELSASGGDTYLWSTGETSQNIIVTPSTTTTYTVTVTNASGCTDTDEVMVYVEEQVIANAGEDVSICEGESVTLTASGGDSYLWSTGETTQSITVNPLNTTTYTVTVSNAFSSDTDDVIVTVNATPIADAGNDVTILEGDSVELFASGGDSYVWSTGETTQNIFVSPSATTTYMVTVTNANGCSDTDEVIIYVQEQVTADAGEDLAICEGETVTLTASGGDDYLWSTGETTQSITVNPLNTTTYTVTVSNAYSSDTDDVTVVVNPLPNVNAGEDVTITIGENVILTATGGNTYLWSTGDTSESISVSPTETTTYSVTTTINGCSDTDEVIVFVEGSNVIANAGEDAEICLGESITLTATGGDYYEWSTGETTQSIDVAPEENTLYTVTVSDDYTSDTDDILVTVINCESEEESSVVDFEYTIYPNPTTGPINVKIGGVHKEAVLSVYNLIGKQMLLKTLAPNNGASRTVPLNLSNMSSGFYLIKLEGEDVSLTKKIILN